MTSERGLLIVVSGPSGAGKGTICKEYLKNHPDTYLSVSATTRAPRAGEVDGESYHFYTAETFERMIADKELLEWAVFCDNYYGTPRAGVENALSAGRDVILEIDVQGAMSVRAHYPEGVYTFVLPPSPEVLYERLKGRGTESEEVIQKRISKAAGELSYLPKYNYCLLNASLAEAVEDFEAVVRAERRRIERSLTYIHKVWNLA